MRPGSLDDLPKYSPWPARLLGLEEWASRVKTPEEIEREFGREKWGVLLERFRNTPGAGLDDVDRWAAGDKGESLVSVDDHLVLMTPEESHAAYIIYIANALKPNLPASALVELGCGYGSVILGLARRNEFAGLPMFAADFTKTGPELARSISNLESVPLTTGTCDFLSSGVADLPIPANALIFTAYAAQYVDPMPDSFVDGIRALHPKAVVHIEPIYEQTDETTLLGLLRRRYIEANGYNRNLSTILHDHEARGSLEIIHEGAPGFGPNPLLAASVISWMPRG